MGDSPLRSTSNSPALEVGTGKTYLTSRVIDHIKETLESSVHDEGFAFFYCNRSGPSMQDPLIILKSFVRQLSYKAHDYNYIQRNVIEIYKLAKKEGRDLSYRDCKELILDSMNLYSKTTIIVDALDESDITLYNLAEILIELMEKSTKPVKVFISSRPGREYLDAFKARSIITVDSSNQQDDIEKYLNENLYSKPFFKGRQKHIQKLIKKTFRSQNGGM
jgi:Cdc6-like AAA superfamily ATPase